MLISWVQGQKLHGHVCLHLSGSLHVSVKPQLHAQVTHVDLSLHVLPG